MIIVTINNDVLQMGLSIQNRLMRRMMCLVAIHMLGAII